MSSDVLMSGDDADDDDKAAVRPPKLTKAGAERFEDVVAWKESWTHYFDAAARAIAETGVFKVYNSRAGIRAKSLSRSTGDPGLADNIKL